MEVIKSSARSPIFRHPGTYLILVLAVSFGLLQITAYNKALKDYNAALVAPIVLSTITVVGTILGAVYFQEYERFSELTVVTLPIGKQVLRTVLYYYS